MAGVGMVTVACNILLVIGVRRRVPCLIRPWMALCFAYLSLMTLGVGKALFYRVVPVKIRTIFVMNRVSHLLVDPTQSSNRWDTLYINCNIYRVGQNSSVAQLFWLSII